MENKPQNVFEKLDKQSEQIDDIASKLEDVNTNDLYALAKRAWDYGDYQAAQKYYNHISLLKPLDWKAPLYSSLCNFRGEHDIYFCTKIPEKVEKIIVSTIKYINSLELDSTKKEIEMAECVEIIKKEMNRTYDNYFKYKDIFNDADSDYIFNLEEYYINVYNEIKNIDLNAIKNFLPILSENVLGLIEATEKKSYKITKDVYDELCALTSKKFHINYEEIFSNNTEIVISGNDLSYSEISEIMMNGIMYFVYNDKAITKRNFKRNLFIGVALSTLPLAGIVISFFGKRYWIFFFLLALLYGILLIIKAITQKDKTKSISFLSDNRIKNKLNSEGNITQKIKFNFFKFITFLEFFSLLIVGLFTCVDTLISKEVSSLGIVLIILVILSVSAFLSNINSVIKYRFDDNGKYIYLYNGKYYKFDR